MATESPRILYFVHDNPAPSGGVWTIYSHVTHLNRNGIPAFAVHYAQGFRPDWFAGEVPTLYSDKGLAIGANDVLVLPENYWMLSKLKELPVRKVIFCQNHFYAFGSLPPGESWRTIGITHVIAASEVIADFITGQLGWSPVPVVHYAVDHTRFKPQVKKRQIAYMPRKRPHDVAFIRGVLRATGSPAAQWPWVAIDNVSLDRSAEILRESEVFLSLSELEVSGFRRWRRWRRAASWSVITATVGSNTPRLRTDSGARRATRSGALTLSFVSWSS